MTGLLLSIMSWFIWYTWNDLTGEVQSKYVTERYFERVEEQGPLVYKSGRILGKKCVGPGCYKTNLTDCSWLFAWYMIDLELIKTRRKDIDWEDYTFDWWGLNSYRIYKLWNQIERSEVKRWDFVYMEFDWWVRHIAVSCDTGATEIYDLYKKSYAECRRYPAPKKALFSKNWIVKLLEDRDVILSWTLQILNGLSSINDKETFTLHNLIGSYYFDYVSILNLSVIEAGQQKM